MFTSETTSPAPAARPRVASKIQCVCESGFRCICASLHLPSTAPPRPLHAIFRLRLDESGFEMASSAGLTHLYPWRLPEQLCIYMVYTTVDILQLLLLLVKEVQAVLCSDLTDPLEVF